MTERILLPVLFVAFYALAAVATEIPVPGTYSNLAYHRRAGDLLGTEIHIVFSFQGHYATFQCASCVPVVVPLKVNGHRIEYTLNESHGDSLCGAGTRMGEVTPFGLEIWRADDPESKLKLKRQRSYWDERKRVM